MWNEGESEKQSAILLMRLQTSCLARNLVLAQLFTKQPFMVVRTSVTTKNTTVRLHSALRLRSIWLMENKQVSAFRLTSNTRILLELGDNPKTVLWFFCMYQFISQSLKDSTAIVKGQTQVWNQNNMRDQPSSPARTRWRSPDQATFSGEVFNMLATLPLACV